MIKKCCANCISFKAEKCKYRSDILYSAKDEMEYHVSCDEFIADARRTEFVPDQPTTVPFPQTVPIWIDNAPACSDWMHCTNPHHDCVNCPLMYGDGGNGSFTSNGSGTLTTSGSGTAFVRSNIPETKTDSGLPR